MHNRNAVLLSVSLVIIATATLGCGKPCRGLLDCPGGEICAANGYCAVDENAQRDPVEPPEPFECPQASDSSVLAYSPGFVVGATKYRCPQPIVVGGDGPRFSALTGNGASVNGGSIVLAGTVDDEAAGRMIVFGILGNGYFVRTLTAEELAQPTLELELFFLANAPAGTYTFFVGVDDGTGTEVRPRPITYSTKEITLIGVESGELQVNVSWDTDADVDLHVIRPDGVEIYYGNRTPEGGGEFDLDSNVGCQTDDPRTENVFWDEGNATSGEYIVILNLYGACGLFPTTNYRLLVLKNGQLANEPFVGALIDGDVAANRREITRVQWP